NGRESIFVKLVQQDAGAQYSLSRAFSILQQMEDLPALLAVLKHLAKLVGTA
ncbi:MAG: restriction endonuclease subunit R, partial [Gemmatimonadaceae bacterium]|nr:restriction endonuclease subunit R [Gloeobacterales cyanobacterium ES-bin-141]